MKIPSSNQKLSHKILSKTQFNLNLNSNQLTVLELNYFQRNPCDQIPFHDIHSIIDIHEILAIAFHFLKLVNIFFNILLRLLRYKLFF